MAYHYLEALGDGYDAFEELTLTIWTSILRNRLRRKSNLTTSRQAGIHPGGCAIRFGIEGLASHAP